MRSPAFSGKANSDDDAQPRLPADAVREPPPEGLTDPLALIAWQAIRRAALRSSLRLSEVTGRGRSAEELSSHLLPLGEMVFRRAFDLEQNSTVRIGPLPVGMLLGSMRHDLLEEIALASDKIGTELTVRMLQAVEAIADQLTNDPSHRFIARFLGAAGLEALVEVAHDMRSPLSSIVLLVETIRMGQSGPVNEIQEHQLALVYSATLGLSLMASDVIELARGDDRVSESAAVPFSVQSVMQSVREIVQPIAEEKKLDLLMEPPPADWRIGNPTALHKVLLNLTTNALKYTDSGSVTVGTTQKSRTAIEFSVTDSGRGIPDHLLGTLFDAFRERDQGGKVTFSSSGLGLSICRKFVRLMGGELTAENLPRGSRFRFTIDLPLAPRF